MAVSGDHVAFAGGGASDRHARARVERDAVVAAQGCRPCGVGSDVVALHRGAAHAAPEVALDPDVRPEGAVDPVGRDHVAIGGVGPADEAVGRAEKNSPGGVAGSQRSRRVGSDEVPANGVTAERAAARRVDVDADVGKPVDHETLDRGGVGQDLETHPVGAEEASRRARSGAPHLPRWRACWGSSRAACSRR